MLQFLRDGVDEGIIQCLAGEQLAGIFGLSHQHGQSGGSLHAKGFGLGGQFGLGRIVHDIQYGLAGGEWSQIQRAGIHVGIHANGSGVDNDLSVGVKAGAFFVCNSTAFTGTADRQDRISAFHAQGSQDRLSATASSQYQGFFACGRDTGASQHIEKSGTVRVIAVELPIPMDDGVDCANCLGSRICKLCNKCDLYINIYGTYI